MDVSYVNFPFSTNQADLGQLGSILELSSPDESQPLGKQSPQKKVLTPQKDTSTIPQKRGTPNKKCGAAKSLVHSFSALTDSVNKSNPNSPKQPNKRLRTQDQRNKELLEAEKLQAQAHNLEDTFVTGKRLCEDSELKVVLEKAKKKRKKGRLASDDSLYRDTREIKEEDVNGGLVIDETESPKVVDAQKGNPLNPYIIPA